MDRVFAAGAVRPNCARLPVLAVSALVLLSACGGGDEELPPEIRPVRTVTIATNTADGTTALTGTVQAENEINQSFRIDGRLIERHVSVGDPVRAGQLIARLDSQNEESSLQSARAQLAAAQARLVEASNNFDRMRDLVAENAVSRAQFDQAEANRTAAASQVESAQSQVTLAENRLGYTRLESSVDGVVTTTAAEPGEVVGAGRMIVQVAREGARDAVFDVPARIKDSAIGRNPQITITLVSDPTVTAKGRVREVSPRADAVTGTFRVRVGLIDPPAAMRLGSTVTGRMRLGESAVIEIPASAVFRSERQSAVWVVDRESGAVSTRNIEVRSSTPSTVIVAAGLAPGDVVVTAGVQALRPGQKVRLLGAGQ
ncbi:MAG: efflux RND transporter periplasmic adaptor subunit [Gammaproteobacteria bacterium]|nr:MAG: efflux RND transporter periplasmic adaptor subunit [Gammaproteobacteria bacterium]